MKTLIMAPLLAAAVLWTAFGALAGNSAKLTDAQIFAIYDQVNGFDIATAELGAVKGSAVEVRELAVMVLRDHSIVRQMARELAQRHNVVYTVPKNDDAARAHQAAMARLKAKSGRDFDEAYLAHETAFHRNAIDAVKTVLLKNLRNAEFKAQLQAVLPGFEHHLAQTIATARKLGYSQD